MKVLFADDDANMRAAVRIILTSAGYEFVGATDGADALEVYASERPDLVILDVMMPRLNGFEVCERLRGRDPELPVLFLTAKGELDDKRAGFGSGADDYMVKPFEGDELLLRVAALLRRAHPGGGSAAVGPNVLAVGGLALNIRRHEALLDGAKVDLTHREFQILAYLAEHGGDAVTKDELVEAVWGSEYAEEQVAVAVYIRHIREKIERDPSHPAYLTTVFRVGYRLQAPAETPA